MLQNINITYYFNEMLFFCITISTNILSSTIVFRNSNKIFSWAEIQPISFYITAKNIYI